MYLERKIDSYLNDWFMLPNHKPLIVKGARQIGKTNTYFECFQAYSCSAC